MVSIDATRGFDAPSNQQHDIDFPKRPCTTSAAPDAMSNRAGGSTNADRQPDAAGSLNAGGLGNDGYRANWNTGGAQQANTCTSASASSAQGSAGIVGSLDALIGDLGSSLNSFFSQISSMLGSSQSSNSQLAALGDPLSSLLGTSASNSPFAQGLDGGLNQFTPNAGGPSGIGRFFVS
jgi:hypothetical protein